MNKKELVNDWRNDIEVFRKDMHLLKAGFEVDEHSKTQVLLDFIVNNPVSDMSDCFIIALNRLYIQFEFELRMQEVDECISGEA